MRRLRGWLCSALEWLGFMLLEGSWRVQPKHDAVTLANRLDSANFEPGMRLVVSVDPDQGLIGFAVPKERQGPDRSLN